MDGDTTMWIGIYALLVIGAGVAAALLAVAHALTVCRRELKRTKRDILVLQDAVRAIDLVLGKMQREAMRVSRR